VIPVSRAFWCLQGIYCTVNLGLRVHDRPARESAPDLQKYYYLKHLPSTRIMPIYGPRLDRFVHLYVFMPDEMSPICPFVQPFVRSFVNTIFWKWMNRFCCTLANGWNDQRRRSGGQSSRSHDADVTFGVLVEASLSTP